MSVIQLRRMHLDGGLRAHRVRLATAATSLFVFLISLVAAAAPEAASAGAEATPPGGSSATRADRVALARTREWHRLVHYRGGTWHESESDVDGDEFFLARGGKTNPEAELEATLDAFAAPIVPGHEDAHALCRFPARRRWLDERLHFLGAWHAPKCPSLERFMATLDIETVTIVYSANFIENPASAFGHTFLRLKKRRSAAEPAGTTNERRDFGVDFVPVPDTNNPFLYAFKGLTGLFPGLVRFHTYEDKAREYGNEEARDMWEYDLGLTPSEVTLVALHLWELAATHIDYLYLTQNCSYGVLATIEAAVPRLDLVSKLKFVVVPKDTIRALFTVPGLVRSVAYRPSLRSRFRAQVERLGPRDREAVERLTQDGGAALPGDFSVAEQVTALDVALYVLDARFPDPESRTDPHFAATRARIVERRAAIAASMWMSLRKPAPAPPPLDKAPERGAGSMRVTLATGIASQYGDPFGALGYRLTLHDLADPPDGEPELSQVQFLDTHLRYDAARRLLTLDTLTFADVMALNPLTRFEKSLSWRARAFGMRLHDRGCPDCFAHGLDIGIGGTLATSDQRAAIFVMADAYAALSGALDGIGGSFVRGGVGPFGGVRLRLPGGTVGVVTGSWSYLPGTSKGSLHATYDVRAMLRGALAENVALGVEAAVQPLSSEATFSSYVYF